ncbi:MAG: DUF1992 domain-containing protein [Acidimicrobiia bacterium]|nr:DUF1992 domain-containing protein [Acidimicrobiia bacterium]
MSERKPPGVGWESWVEKQIREGMERGEFDQLPGSGKPLADVGDRHDDLWWVKQKLKREEVSYLPPTLAIRKERDDALEKVAASTSEQEVRRILTGLNERIRYVNSHTVTGPPSTLMPLDLDELVARWLARREGQTD